MAHCVFYIFFDMVCGQEMLTVATSFIDMCHRHL